MDGCELVVGGVVMLQWLVVWCLCDRKGRRGSGKGKEYDVFWTVGRRRRRE
jgi:hypothetical protein